MKLKTHHHNNTTKYHLLLILSAKLRLLLQAPLYIITTRLPNSDIQNTTFFQKNVIFYIVFLAQQNAIRKPEKSDRHRSKKEGNVYIFFVNIDHRHETE